MWGNMQTNFSYLLRLASGRNVLLAAMVFLMMAAVIMPLAKRDIQHISQGALPLDLSLWYSPKTALQTLGSYGESGRHLYRFIQLTADVVYPVVYTIFFCLLLSWVCQKTVRRYPSWWLFFPLIILFFDLLENACIVAMLTIYPQFFPWVAAVSGAATLLKWISLGLFLGQLVFTLLPLSTPVRSRLR